MSANQRDPNASPSATAEQLHRVSPEEALAFVDNLLGPADTWPSPLLAYRLKAAFQADWKVELGQWLKAAEQHAFLDRVVKLIEREKRPVKGQTDKLDPHDRRHLKLHQAVATARIVHYLTATGWGFQGVETETGGAIDIDCALAAPTGELVEFQVKSPTTRDPNAQVRPEDDKNDEERVIIAVDNGAAQLPKPARGHAFVVICSNWDWSLAYEPECLVKHLIGGRTVCYQGSPHVFLEGVDENPGKFFTPEWEHVSGVLLLDLVRGYDARLNTCTVLTNSNATFSANPDWFPFARVCVLEGEEFHWVRGEPADGILPDGTLLQRPRRSR
jgi:hypothetical protein